MDLELVNSHVLVSGASRGIGLACVKAFLEEGAIVSAVARNTNGLIDMRNSMGAFQDRIQIYAEDLTDSTRSLNLIHKIESQNGPIDILVNCAGSAARKNFSDLEISDWKDSIDRKFFSYMNLINPLIKKMKERNSGVITNIVGAGGKRANPSHLTGGTANAALMLASVGLAHSYASNGIRVNVINPSSVKTERLKSQINFTPNPSLPMGRHAEPEEIANVAVFISSKKSSYINGAVISMDGASIPTIL